MKRLGVLVVAGLLIAGCGGGSSSPKAATSGGHHSAIPIPVAKSVCSGFRTFTVEMMRRTPKDQVALVPYAISVARAAVRTRVPRPEFIAASNLAAWVGSTDFPENGNVLSPQYRAMQRYC